MKSHTHLNWFHLIFVKFAVLVGRLSLVLEGDDNETDEDVDHEEGYDDDVYEVEDSNNRTEVVGRTHVLLVGVNGDVKDAGPAFKGRHDEQREHGLGHVVVVEGVPIPDSLLHDRIVQVAILVHDELALALLLGHLGSVRAHEELAFEQLDANDGEHELEEQGDQHDVADGLHGHDDALDDVLEALGPVNGPQGPEHTQYTEDLDHGDGTGAKRSERRALVRGWRSR